MVDGQVVDGGRHVVRRLVCRLVDEKPALKIVEQIGVGVGQIITGQARALCILKAQNGVPDWQKVEALIKEWQPDAIVVGLGKRWQLKPLYAGTKVAFVSRYSGKPEVYVTNLARSRVLQLTKYQSSTNSPRWSADGSRVFFVTSYRTGFPEIFSSNGIGEASKVITNVRGALGGASQRVAGKLSVGLQVAHVVALADALVGKSLGHMALACARFAHNQRIGPLGDELQGVQLKARSAGYLGVKAPVQVRQ